MTFTYGVAALGRPTFDVPYAEDMMRKAFAAIAAAGIRAVGPQRLLYDAAAAEEAMREIARAGRIDALLILQVTFTDATMTVKLAREATAPVAVWAVPEPRAGGRLRLNAFCGLNLAAHALGKAGVPHHWLYAAPDAKGLADSLRSFAAPAALKPSAARREGATSPKGAAALDKVRGAAISVVGEHPAGFDTCEFNETELARLAGVKVNRVPLSELFERARAVPESRAKRVRMRAAEALSGLDAVDQAQLDRSFRVFCALDDISRDTKAKGLAVRCWPETFTDYGCAACGPMAMMNEKRVPSACEADVYGSFTALMLQELADEPAWMADLVDVDAADGTGVFWHCGLAPLSMCDPEARPEATIHTNRKMPLLHQFPLKPGRFTFARLSQARGEMKLVIGEGEFLRRPMAFTGTSGVFRFARPLGETLQSIMDEALEHHFAIAYGDHREALKGIAASLDLPALEIA
ncbi:MAG: L-fucose/L-arabinose isomerase family protein [Parvularculaceae bacterium]